MLLEVVEIVGYYLPCIGLQAWLLVELAVEVGVVLQFLTLSQQGVVVAIGIPEEDGVVVQHVGFGVVVRTPVDGDAARTYCVENLLGNITLYRGVLGANIKLILFEEFGFIVVESALQFVGVVEEFSCAVDLSDGVETFNHTRPALCTRIVGPSVAGDQCTKSVTCIRIPALMTNVFAYLFYVVDSRVGREHLKYPQGESHISRVVCIVETETEVDAAVVKEVVQVGRESGVVVVLTIEIETIAVVWTGMNYCVQTEQVQVAETGEKDKAGLGITFKESPLL